MKIPPEAAVRSLRRMLLLACLGAIVLLLTALWRHDALGTTADRVAGACVALGILSVVAVAAAWWQRRPHESLEFEAPLLVTAFAGVLCLTYIAFLRLVPSSLDVPPDDRRLWEYLDRRWVWGIYLSALGLVYTPALVRWAIDASSTPREWLRSKNARLAAAVGIGVLCVALLATPQIRLPLAFELYLLCAFLAWWRAALPSSLSPYRLIAAYAAGLALAVILIGPHGSTIVQLPIDAHETGHLGSLQAISQGATPFVGARTQYGPGHQLITYALMQRLGFTMAGFRLSHVIVNIAGAGVLFGTAFFAFGWGAGALVAVVALYMSPYMFWSWRGWGIILRWIPPLLAGAILPLALQHDFSRLRRRTATVMLGAACGLLLWFAQDTMASTMLAVLLLLAGTVFRRKMTLAAAASTFAAFVLSAMAVFLLVVIATVGVGNVRAFLADYMRGSMLLEGMQNQAWYEPFRPWGIVFYLTPFILLLITIVTLYARSDGPAAGEERTRAQVFGMAAAASALVPITLLRSGTGNLIASSTALPAALVLSLIYLPAMITRVPHLRELTRVLLVTAFLFIYPMPSGASEIARDYVPSPGSVRQGITRMLTLPSVPATATLLERRLGFTPKPNDLCCTGAADLTYEELNAFLTTLHQATEGRSVYVDYTVLMPSSGLYFLADLKVGTTMPEPTMFLWFQSDKEAFWRELRAAPPACTLTSPLFLEGGTAQQLLFFYRQYTQVAIGGRQRQADGNPLFPILVFCRR